MSWKVIQISLTILVGTAALTCAALLAGRVLRANAPEIAFIRGHTDVYVLDVDRAFVYQIAHTDLNMNEPRWSPDGHKLTFIFVDGSGSTSIERMDTNGRIHRLYREAASIWATAWSPDGDELAFVTDKQMFVMDADGQNRRPLDTPISSRSYSLSWSPDGQHMAFIGGGMGIVPFVYLLDMTAQSDTQRAVTTLPANPLTRPSWSPDSQQLAFVSNYSLFVANADGSRERFVADATTSRASSWSPDGRLAYISGLQLYIATPDEPSQAVATGVQVTYTPAWSADGRWLAFASDGELYVMNPDGGEPRLITLDNDSRAITDFTWRE